MKRLSEITDTALSAFETFVLMAALLAMVSVLFAQGVLGDLFHIKFFTWPWALELSKYLLVWVMGAGASVAVREKRHIGIELLALVLPEKPRKAVATLVWALCAAACFAAIAPAAEYVRQAREYGLMSDTIDLPEWYAYIAMPVSAALLGARFSLAAIGESRGNSAPRAGKEEEAG